MAAGVFGLQSTAAGRGVFGSQSASAVVTGTLAVTLGACTLAGVGTVTSLDNGTFAGLTYVADLTANVDVPIAGTLAVTLGECQLQAFGTITQAVQPPDTAQPPATPGYSSHQGGFPRGNFAGRGARREPVTIDQIPIEEPFTVDDSQVPLTAQELVAQQEQIAQQQQMQELLQAHATAQQHAAAMLSLLAQL
jgi:hypothetical protein